MINAVVTYILQLVNLYVLFQVILCHGFQKKKSIFIIGLCIVIFGLIVRIAMFDNMNPLLGMLILRGGIIIYPMLCFDINWIKGILISMNYRLISSFFFSACGDAVGTQLILFGIQCLGVLILRKFTEERSRGNNIDIGLLIILMIGLILIDSEVGMILSSGDVMYREFIGEFKVLTCFLACVYTAIIFLLQLLINQRTQLKELNLQNEKCIEDQIVQYESVLEKDQKLRVFRHDVKAHLTAIKKYAEEADLDNLRVYLREIHDIADTATYYHTGNMVLDAILNQYVEESKENEIVFLLMGQAPPNIQIKETDLCILFSNAISNAYEATLECEGEKSIVVKITYNENYLFITIENPSIHTIQTDGLGLKSSKTIQEHHGVGTRNMQKVAKKYDGNVKWDDEDGIIKTSIQLKFCER